MEKDTHHVSHNEGFLYFTGTSSCTSHFRQQIPNRARVPGINHLQQALDCTSNYKRSGVNPSALALFYRARILSVLSYSAPCWYPHVLDNGKTKLGRHQKYCTRVIIHYEEDYDNRLSILKLSKLNIIEF